MTHTQEEIKEALRQHQLYLAYRQWLVADTETRGEGPPKGVRFALKDLQEANLRWANLRGANLREANLRGAILRGAILSGANLTEANLWQADLWKANLMKANLREANLRGAILRGANLSGAKLTEANLWQADLWKANLWQADLTEANLWKANLTEANLSGAIGNGKEVKSILADKYHITWTDTDLAIGCRQHPLADWLAFSDEEKAGFADDALEYLNKWLPVLDSMGVFDTVKRKETE